MSNVHEDFAERAVAHLRAAVVAAEASGPHEAADCPARPVGCGVCAPGGPGRPVGPVIDEALPEIMSMTEVAALYGVSRQSVHQMILKGKLPARQAGTTWVVRRVVAEGVTVDGELLGVSAESPADTPGGQ